MVNKSWKYLKRGDVIDIIAPSSTVATDDLINYFSQVKKSLATIGLIAHIPDDLIDLEAEAFSANKLEYRTQHLIKAFNNNESKAIWAIRGGYGAAKIIPFLDQIAKPTQTKLLLGFSDITALHLFVGNKWQFNSMHSAVINQIINNSALLAELAPILFGEKKSIKYDQLIPLNDAAKMAQIIYASITGGNLSIVQTSLATSWQIQAQDKIIFLEDVGEQGYRIDRMLNHLLQAGIFAKAKAIIFGEITPPIGAGEAELCELAVSNFAAKLEIPVLSLSIIGHNLRHNSPLPLGPKSTLFLGEKPRLECVVGGR